MEAAAEATATATATKNKAATATVTATDAKQAEDKLLAFIECCNVSLAFSGPWVAPQTCIGHPIA